MSSLKVKSGCFFIVILIQTLKVSCENITTPTISSEDLITSSLPLTVKALTSPTAESADGATTNTQSSNDKIKTSSETNLSATKTVAKTTSHPVTQTTDIDNKPATEHPLTRHRKPTHHSEPTHHGESNNTHSNESDHVVHTGTNGTMKHPHEPPVVDASTQEKVDGGWQISIVVVFGLVGGIVLFVIVMVIKNNREMRHVRLREEERKRRRAIRQSERALRRMKAEEAKPRVEKKKEEHRLSFFKADPEESIPLLELHIMDGEAPVLSGHIERQDRTQHTEPYTEPSTGPSNEPSTDKDTKLLLEENGNMPSEISSVEIV